MKREVCCPDHAAWWRDEIPRAEADGERIRVVDGRARRDMRCDFCNAPITVGDECSAISLLGYGQEDMPGWESAFIEVWP